MRFQNRLRERQAVLRIVWPLVECHWSYAHTCKITRYPIAKKPNGNYPGFYRSSRAALGGRTPTSLISEKSLRNAANFSRENRKRCTCYSIRFLVQIMKVGRYNFAGHPDLRVSWSRSNSDIEGRPPGAARICQSWISV